jgi:hypothetical protein
MGPAHPAAARRVRRIAVLVLAALAIGAACHGRPPLVALEAGPPLRLVAAPGVRINARLKPALELEDGTVVRFDSPRLTVDSAYFAEAPTIMAPVSPHSGGTLRVSVCSSGEAICRSLEIAVAW